MPFGSLTHSCGNEVLTSWKLLPNQLFLETPGDQALYPFNQKRVRFLRVQIEWGHPPWWGEGATIIYQLNDWLSASPSTSQQILFLASFQVPSDEFTISNFFIRMAIHPCLPRTGLVYTCLLGASIFNNSIYSQKHSNLDDNKYGPPSNHHFLREFGEKNGFYLGVIAISVHQGVLLFLAHISQLEKVFSPGRFLR